MKKEENINSIDTLKRLNDYILTLKSKRIIVHNNDIASSGIAREETISRAINGKGGNLTKSLLKKILNHYGEHGFTLEYIWEGKGKDTVYAEHKELKSSNSESNIDIKNKPHDEQMEILQKEIIELKNENNKLSDKIDDTITLIELYLAPIAMKMEVNIDQDLKKKLLEHLN